MDREPIMSPLVPAARSPISQAVRAGGLVFTSMTPPWRVDYTLAEGDFGAQMRQCMDNLILVLEESGSSLSQALKMTIVMARIQDSDEMNMIYAEYMQKHFTAGGFPARSSFEGRMGRKEFLVEVECVAVIQP